MKIAEQIHAAGEASPLTPLTLGLVSLLHRAARALTDDRPHTTSGGANLPPFERTDPVVLAALGVLALERSLRRWIAVAGSPSALEADLPCAEGSPLARAEIGAAGSLLR